jgi:hypothetical protein
MMASPGATSHMANIIASFCRDHLDESYRELAQRMTAALCWKRPSPLTSGQPRTWACAIVYVLGQIRSTSCRTDQLSPT